MKYKCSNCPNMGFTYQKTAFNRIACGICRIGSNGKLDYPAMIKMYAENASGITKSCPQYTKLQKMGLI